MSKIARTLKMDGHKVDIWGYPSKEKKIHELVDDLVRHLIRKDREIKGRTFSFVSHSLGGILLRGAFNHPKCPESMKKGRLVMIAPPNQGCKFARKTGQFKLVRKWLGKEAGRELIAKGFEKVGQVPSTVDVLVIAGKSKKNFLIGGDNDTIIKVEETRLKTPHKHVVVKADHNQIVYEPEVLKYVKKFIKRAQI